MASRNTDKSIFRNIDWVTIVIYVVMVFAGVISIYAASYDYDQANLFDFNEFSGKQICWIGMAFVLGFVLLLIDSRMYETYAYPIFTIMMLLLAVTIFIAPDIKGSHSWIVMGPMSLQPAEFAKFATALALAKLFSGYNFTLNAKASNFIRAISIILLPIILILCQHETGSALTFLALAFVLYREGMSGLVLFAALFAIVIFIVAVKYADTMIFDISVGEFAIFIMIMVVMVGMLAIYSHKNNVARNVALWFIGTGIVAWLLSLFDITIPYMTYFIAVIVVACAYCLFETIRLKTHKLLITIGTAILSMVFMFSVNYVMDNILEPHQQMRIKVTLGIEEDLKGSGYNVNQSKIAIGSGGFAGKGFLKGTQTKLKYVPEQHTDFIFCTIGEEEGFWGATTVVVLFLVLILRVLTLAERQPTTFGRVYAYCVASYMIFHMVINIGMVIGLCPVIGIPLPFFSYGGSSLWGFTLLLFILLNIDASRRSHLSY